MRRAVTTIALVLALAACGEAGGGRMLRYGDEPGTTRSYDVTATVTGSTTFEGDAAEGGPLEAAIDMTTGYRLGYAFEEDAAPEDLLLTMSIEVTDLDGTVSAFGDSQELSIEDLGTQPPPMVVTIDDRGTVVGITEGQQALPTEMLDALGSAPAALLTPQHFGPEFPEEPVGIGDAWTTDATVSRFGFAIETHGEHRVVAEEQVEGRPTLRIESTIDTSPTELSMEDLLRAMAQPGEEIDQDQIDLLVSMFETLGGELSASVAGSTTTMTTWFDPEAGVVVRLESTQPQAADLAMHGAEGQGGDVAISVRLETLTAATLAP